MLERGEFPILLLTGASKRAARHLHFPSEIPGGEQIRWSIDSLYQRNVDWQRVTRQIAPYLRATDVELLVNAVTVVLLPYSRNERNSQIDFYADGA